jgi:formate-dependent nitrite reductase membrane component NrfD
MVPDAEFRSYYGMPVLNQPTWEPRDIAGYFFLGGLAGASSFLGAGAAVTGRRQLARTLRVGAAGAAGLSLVALVHDLGKPQRFLMMLRMVKVTSPMSIGSWLLAGYAPAAVAAAGTDVLGVLPRVRTTATVAAAALGPAVASYTAALMCNTAVPAWHDGHREMPFVFASSAASAAGGLGLLGAPVAQAGPARLAGAGGALIELGVSTLMEHRMGMVAEPYSEGRSGQLLKAAKALSLAGAVGALTAARRSRSAAAASGTALLAGSALTRFGIFAAGQASAADPKYTVEPQRERLQARAGAAP